MARNTERASRPAKYHIDRKSWRCAHGGEGMSVPCVECSRESEHSCVCGPCGVCGRRKPLARDGMCGEHTDLADYVDYMESMGPGMVSPCDDGGREL